LEFETDRETETEIDRLMDNVSEDRNLKWGQSEKETFHHTVRGAHIPSSHLKGAGFSSWRQGQTQPQIQKQTNTATAKEAETGAKTRQQQNPSQTKIETQCQSQRQRKRNRPCDRDQGIQVF
jgi:hypothetical protein